MVYFRWHFDVQGDGHRTKPTSATLYLNITSGDLKWFFFRWFYSINQQLLNDIKKGKQWHSSAIRHLYSDFNEKYELAEINCNSIRI